MDKRLTKQEQQVQVWGPFVTLASVGLQ